MGLFKFSTKQKEVIDAPISDLLVSAAAGSGKTAVLVERIMQRMCRIENPQLIDRLLIVTFTRNAAASLREKIDKAINKRLQDEELSPEVKIHLRMQKVMLPYAEILTIDGFCTRLLKSYFYLTDIDPNYRIGDGQECIILLDNAIKKVLDKEYERTEGKDVNTDPFLRTVMAYGDVEGDQGLTDMIRMILARSESQPFPEDYINSLDRNYMIFNDDELNASKLGTLVLKRLKNRVRGIYDDNLRLISKAESLIAGRPKLAKINTILESDSEVYKSILNAKSFTEFNDLLGSTSFMTYSVARNLDEDDERIKKLVKAERDALTGSIKNDLKPAFGFDREEFYKINAGVLPFIDEIIRLTLAVRRAYMAEKKKRNIMEFGDISHKVLELLIDRKDGEYLPSETAKEIAKKYDEIMIDEYQDSNIVQEMILRSISGGTDGMKNVFMVGDVKQSIYAFRMAKPELFTEKYDRYTEEGDEVKIDLSQNFRSTLGVIEGVNSVFGSVMKREFCGIEYDENQELKTGELYKDFPEIENTPSELLVIDAPDSKSDERIGMMISVLADEIKNAIDSHMQVVEDGKCRDITYGDICILARSLKGCVAEIANTLADCGIPVNAQTGEGYFKTLEIRHMIDFLKIIDNPYQDIEYAAVLRSFIGGLTDEELAWIRIYDKENGKGNSYLYDTVIKILGDEKYQGEFKKKLEVFNNKYEKLRDISMFVSLRELLSQIYAETGYYEYAGCLPAGKQRRANLDMLLIKAEDFEKTDLKGIGMFLAYIDRLTKFNLDEGEAGVTDSADSVSIMTIHGSKGLEFPLVFLINLEKKYQHKESAPQGDESRKKRKKSPKLRAHHEYGLAIKQPDEELKVLRDTVQHNLISVLADHDQDCEEMRLLYVGMTRAKQKLVMITAVKDLNDTENGKTGRKNAWLSTGTRGFSIGEIEKIGRFDDMVGPIYVKGGNPLLHYREVSAEELLVSGGEDEEFPELPDKEELGRIREYLDYRYPYRRSDIPTKYSVSELKHAAIEEYELELENNRLFTDSAIKEEGPHGKEYGTLVHLLMYRLVPSGITEEEDVGGYIEKLVSDGAIEKEDAKRVNVRKISAFLKSPLCERMRKADKEDKLFLEQPFVYAMPASRVKPDYDGDERVLLQGVVDAFFEENGELVVLDYKTDLVDNGEAGEDRLRKLYGRQLDCYEEALASIFKKSVKEKIIYSFSLENVVYC